MRSAADLPSAPGEEWGSAFNLPGVSSPPFDVGDLQGALYRWSALQGGTAFAPEPAPLPPAEPPPVLVPPPGPPPPNEPLPPPANEPVFAPEPPTVIEPQLPPDVSVPPIEPPTSLPPDIPIGPIGAGIGGQIIVAIGGILWPTPTAGPNIDTNPTPPPVHIPTPRVSLPQPKLPPLPQAPPVEFPVPQPPEIIVVTPSAPPYSPGVPAPQPAQQTEPFPWPFLFPFPPPISAQAPAPAPSAPPLPSMPPLPSTPSIPAAPPVPSSPPLPRLPNIPPGMTSTPPLTAANAPPVESAQQCETPQQTRDRRQARRDSCTKLLRIKVRAHFRKVCVSEAVSHVIRHEKKKLVREFVTRPAGKVGRAAADWALEHMGLTPYAKQAKETKQRVRELTKRQKPIQIPGTNIYY